MKNTSGLLHGGVKGNKGGTGRPKSWLIKKCKDLIERKKIIEFLADVASGKAIETVPNPDYSERNGLPRTIIVPASTKDRLTAARELLDRGFGKAEQAVTGPDGGPIKFESETDEEMISRMKRIEKYILLKNAKN